MIKAHRWQFLLEQQLGGGFERLRIAADPKLCIATCSFPQLISLPGWEHLPHLHCQSRGRVNDAHRWTRQLCNGLPQEGIMGAAEQEGVYILSQERINVFFQCLPGEIRVY